MNGLRVWNLYVFLKEYGNATNKNNDPSTRSRLFALRPARFRLLPRFERRHLQRVHHLLVLRVQLLGPLQRPHSLPEPGRGVAATQVDTFEGNVNREITSSSESL